MDYWEDEMRRLRRELLRAAREFGRALDEVFEEFRRGLGIQQRFVRPFVDVYEADGEVVVVAEIPGVRKEDIEVYATENTLEIKAEAKSESEERGERYLHRERYYGGYYRRVRLPVPVNPAGATATYENGVLRVRLPKAERARGMRINIQ